MHYMHREHAMRDQHTHAARDRVGIEKQSVSTLCVSDILPLRTLVCTPSLIEQQNTHMHEQILRVLRTAAVVL